VQGITRAYQLSHLVVAQIEHWSQFERGGHFPAMAVLDLLVTGPSGSSDDRLDGVAIARAS
jgi:hypothetical protein